MSKASRLTRSAGRLLMALVALVAAVAVQAQELNCNVEVNADKVANANKEIFKTLQQAIADYMNTNKWTDAQFGANEKIECKLFLTISS